MLMERCLMSIEHEKCKDPFVINGNPLSNFWRTTQLESILRFLMERHEDFWQVTEDSLDKSMKAFDIDFQ